MGGGWTRRENCWPRTQPPPGEPPTSAAWLLLDIDGTIGIEGRPPYGEDLLMASVVNGNVTIWPHVPGLLRDAQAAGAQLAWYSAWEEDANPVISSALGQPPLPKVGDRGRIPNEVREAYAAAN